MLTLEVSHLKEKKNLLAFSAGVDSSALFFLLLHHNIPFDIALVNYGTRANSDTEESHAKDLARQYNLTCHTIKAPHFSTHFEQNARKFRYDFFEKLIQEQHYDTLLTAHQLNDQLEWLLMRLTKGDNNQYPYFIDESNSDEKYERNLFRKQFSDPLMAEYKEGIKRSFDYLKQDKKQLEENFELIYSQKELRIIKLHASHAKVKATDLALKELGYLLSASQRKEVANEENLVIGGKWAVTLQDDLLYIAPYLTTDMPKKFKEACRVLKIPSKIRAYCFEEEIDITSL